MTYNELWCQTYLRKKILQKILSLIIYMYSGIENDEEKYRPILIYPV